MNLTHRTASGKPIMPSRLRPTRQEGLYIQYRLKSLGKKLTNISRDLNLNNSTFYNVIYGKRCSARIEAEIARILGKANWSEVVLEARSEVQKKPVKVILREMEQEKREIMKGPITLEQMQASRDWGPYLKQMRKEAAEAQAEQERAKRRGA